MGVVRVFQSIMATNISNSPIRLGVGGSPRFVAHVIIHQMVSNGVISLNPRVRASVRVLFRSYSNFARQNNEEDINPCAIIRVNAPFIPQRERENIPEATMLIWPTEE